MRTFSNSALATLFAAQSSEVFLLLIEIEHSSFGVLRYVQNTENTTSGGNEYTALAELVFTLPADQEGDMPQVDLTMPDIMQEIRPKLRNVPNGKPDARAGMILASAPDDLEIDWMNFRVYDMDYDLEMVKLTLAFEDLMNEQFPGHSFTPGEDPGIFGTSGGVS